MTDIYILIDPLTNQCRYVGKTINAKKRYRNHLKHAKRRGRKTKVYAWISSLLKKDELPEILVIDTVEDWIYWEKFYISYFKSIGCNLTNLDSGGQGNEGYKHTDQFKRDVSERMKGNTYALGVKPSDETKKLISESMKGRKQTASTKDKIGKSNAKSHQKKSKLTIDNVKDIKKSNLSRKELALKYDVTYWVIVDILLGRRWSNV